MNPRYHGLHVDQLVRRVAHAIQYSFRDGVNFRPGRVEGVEHQTIDSRRLRRKQLQQGHQDAVAAVGPTAPKTRVDYHDRRRRCVCFHGRLRGFEYGRMEA
jgi:hypothetical protein